MNNTVRRKKLRLGLLYGIVAGVAFSIFAWGIDALVLARSNASYYWIKALPGLILGVCLGGVAGWLTIFFHKHSLAILFWGFLAVTYTWSVVWLPFTFTPQLIRYFNPDFAGLVNFSVFQDINQFRIIGLLIVGVVAIICGLLELNLIDQAILSSYRSGSVGALLICAVLFAVAGSATDQMINVNLREPVQILNSMLQFAQDNFGMEVPKTTARQMHLSAANQLGSLIQKPRRLTLVGVDENIVMLDVIVDFAGTKAKCSTIFSQPTDCIILTSNP